MYKRILLVAGLAAVTTTALAAAAPVRSPNSGFFSNLTVWLGGGINFPGNIETQDNQTDPSLISKYKDSFIMNAGLAVPILYSARFGSLSLQSGYSYTKPSLNDGAFVSQSQGTLSSATGSEELNSFFAGLAYMTPTWHNLALLAGANATAQKLNYSFSQVETDGQTFSRDIKLVKIVPSFDAGINLSLRKWVHVPLSVGLFDIYTMGYTQHGVASHLVNNGVVGTEQEFRVQKKADNAVMLDLAYTFMSS